MDISEMLKGFAILCSAGSLLITLALPEGASGSLRVTADQSN